MSRYLTKLIGRARDLPDQFPPTFLLPFRQHLSTVTTTATTTNPSPPPDAYTPIPHSEIPKHPISTDPVSPQSPLRSTRRHPQLSRHSLLPPPTNPLSASLQLLTNLAAQPPHYISAHIHARPYLLTQGDTLRLPFHMPNATPGTVLRLNRATMLGSRDFTFRGEPWVDEKYFVCRAVVTGVESEPMRVKKKTKRRQRKVKTVKSKMRYTILRVTELKVLPNGEMEGAEEVMGEEEDDGGLR